MSSRLKEIMERYDYQLPHLADQTINEKIKMVGEMAGLEELIEIVTTKGGTPKREQFKKYELTRCRWWTRLRASTTISISAYDYRQTDS